MNLQAALAGCSVRPGAARSRQQPGIRCSFAAAGGAARNPSPERQLQPGSWGTSGLAARAGFGLPQSRPQPRSLCNKLLWKVTTPFPPRSFSGVWGGGARAEKAPPRHRSCGLPVGQRVCTASAGGESAGRCTSRSSSDTFAARLLATRARRAGGRRRGFGGNHKLWEGEKWRTKKSAQNGGSVCGRRHCTGWKAR